MKKIKVKSIWISDVHLGTKACKAKELHQFLKRYECDTLYLVGDIIDGWRIKKKGFYFPQPHQDVIRRILNMAKKESTEVIYITGNHDEFWREYVDFNLELGNLRIVDECIHKSPNGDEYLVIHGDAFDGVVKYHKVLAHLGDSAYEFVLWLNTHFNNIRSVMGLKHWSLSAYLKMKVKEAVSFIYEYETVLVKECDTRNVDGVICGHIHHAEITVHEINNHKIKYFNCGDWVESCTALLEDFDGNITIHSALDET